MKGWLNRWLGTRGERLAARFLRRAGLKILARQYRQGRGEIDLIALDGDCIVFVEVKTRHSTAQGEPWESVDHRKQRQLTRLALQFLKSRNLLGCRSRFDVVSIIWPKSGEKPEITHFRNAFPAVDDLS